MDYINIVNNIYEMTANQLEQTLAIALAQGSKYPVSCLTLSL